MDLLSKVWCSHCYTLAQARRVSLSETDGLASAKVPGLNENAANSVFVCFMSWFVYYFLSKGSYMHVLWRLDLKD